MHDTAAQPFTRADWKRIDRHVLRMRFFFPPMHTLTVRMENGRARATCWAPGFPDITGSPRSVRRRCLQRASAKGWNSAQNPERQHFSTLRTQPATPCLSHHKSLTWGLP